MRVLAVRHRRFVAMLALTTAAVVVAVVVLSAGSGSPKRTRTALSGSSATAVERRDLVETDTESGTLSYAKSRTVYNRLSGTITWLPSVGRVIKPGQTLFMVGAAPVILMNGATPAYRDLSATDGAGNDILQLNRNLIDLGFNPESILANDEWQAATTAGVDFLQASLGETETGTLSLGQIVFLPGEQLISTIDATLGSTGGGSPAATNASTPAAAAAPEFVGLTPRSTASPKETTTTPSTSTTPKTTKPKTAKRKPTQAAGQQPSSSRTLAGLTALLKAEAEQLKAATAALKAAKASAGTSAHASSSNSTGNSSSRNSTSSSSSGSGASASAILQTTSTRLIVTVDLGASKQSEAKVGERVAVQMPAGNNVNGRITAVSRVAQSSSSSGNSASSSASNGSGSGASGATIPVTITLTGRHQGDGLDQAAVSVNFAQAKARNVLSVPVTALLATPGGAYAVQEAAAPHNLIPVTTGLFAAGYVRISGSGIYPGLQVTDSQG